MKSGDAIDSADIQAEGEFPVYGGNGLRGYTGTKTHSLAAPLVGRQGALCGNVNFASGDFYATEHAIVARPRDGVNARWLFWLLSSLNLNQYSMAAAQPGLAVEVVERVRAMRPSAQEQQTVANFLDEQTGRIDALIAAKEQLCERLNELKRAHLEAEMAEALTAGTWQLRRAIKFLGQGWSPVAENGPAAEGAWGVLKLSAVKHGMFSPGENKELSEGTEIPSGLRIRSGDVLVTRANTPELVGSAAVVDSDDYKLIPSDLIYTLRVDLRRLNPKFLTLFLLSPQSRAAIEVDARGSSQSMVKLSQEHIRSWKVPAVSIDAQNIIVSQLTTSLGRFDQLRRHAVAHIELLHEYRSSLISAAVAGQLDISAFKEAA